MYTHLKRLLWVIKQDEELAILYVDDYGPKKITSVQQVVCMRIAMK